MAFNGDVLFSASFGAYSRSILDPSNQGRLFFVLLALRITSFTTKLFQSEIRYSIWHGTSNCYCAYESLSKDIGTFRADRMLCRVDGWFDSSIKKKAWAWKPSSDRRLLSYTDLAMSSSYQLVDMHCHRIQESW